MVFCGAQNPVSGADVRCARVRFTGDRTGMNFAWIMVDHTSVKLNGSDNAVDKLWVHTNDFDLMAGSPLSFSETCALNEIDAVIETATQYVATQVGTSARVDLLLQTDFNGGKREDNYGLAVSTKSNIGLAGISRLLHERATRKSNGLPRRL